MADTTGTTPARQHPTVRRLRELAMRRCDGDVSKAAGAALFAAITLLEDDLAVPCLVVAQLYAVLEAAYGPTVLVEAARVLDNVRSPGAEGQVPA